MFFGPPKAPTKENQQNPRQSLSKKKVWFKHTSKTLLLQVAKQFCKQKQKQKLPMLQALRANENRSKTKTWP